MKILLTDPPKSIFSNDLSKGRQIHSGSNAIKQETVLPTLALYHLASSVRESGHTITVLDTLDNRVRFSDNAGINLMNILKTSNFAIYRTSFSDPDLIEVVRLTPEYPKVQFPTLEKRLKDVDVIGISTSSLYWFLAKAMIERIKAIDPEIPIILGGIHPTYADDYILKTSKADYAVRGEGEKTLPELLDAIEKNKNFKDVPGITYKEKNNGKINRNEDRPSLTISELEETPLPAFDLMPSNLYAKIDIESSRGCKFSCSFCAIPFKKLWRGLDPKVVQKRVEHALDFSKKLFGDKAINILDDSFATDRKRAEQILNNLSETDFGDMHLTFEARPDDLLNSNIFKFCAKLPINHILTGVELGYDTGLKKTKKGTTTKMVEKCVALAERYGIAKSLICSTIIGFPWETKEDCMKTVDFVYNLASKYDGTAYVNWLQFTPGCDLWDNRKSYGINEGFELYETIGWATKEFRLKLSSKLKEEDFIEIKKRIDQYQFFILAGLRRGQGYYGDAWINQNNSEGENP